ncbi:calcium-binding protein [Roseovarius arcticus]|uniref:calcium-binding protein n=1 Tax=Roseovarius arcticus TaxID=2547404 RepID=UPI0011109935|nr:calcium-binding protein [Roseovarius arcticus]
MIEVKGIRSGQSDTDPSDPLELQKPAGGNAKFISGWFGSLIGLGFYIRSFLWSEPQAGVPSEEEFSSGGDNDADGSSPPRGKASLVASKQAPTAEQRVTEEGEDQTAVPFPFPVVSGPFDTLLFAPLSVSSIGADAPRGSANAPLPPYNWMGELDPSRLNTSPLGVYSPAAGSANGGQLAILPADPTDEAGPQDETNDAQDQVPNRAPRNKGPVILGDVGSGAAVAFALSYFLSQTNDPDGNLLSVSMGASTSGTLDQKGDGWRYLADTDFLGEVRIDYTITDGGFSLPQSAFLNIVENNIVGSEGADLIVGGRGRDLIEGQDGDDNLAGLGGPDRLFGGSGNDNISGGDGDDSIFGGEGDDLIVGGAGNDWISGGAGQDQIYGNDGDDEIYGDAGNDQIYGGTGADTLFGGAGDDDVWGGTDDDVISGDAGRDRLFGERGNDVILAGMGDDTVFGGEGDDLIFGGVGNDMLDGEEGDDILSGESGNDRLAGDEGNDVLTGGEGLDTVSGGAGDDLLIADDDAASDIYDGGEGYDQLDYSAATKAVSFDLADGTASGESTGIDTFTNVEHFVGSAWDDIFRAGAGEGKLTGNGGSNLYNFAQGDTVDIYRSIYQITDYDSDDEIWISMGSSQRHIRNAQRSIEDRVEDGLDDYADDIGADEPRLSFRHDWTDTYRRTVIEVDFDRDKVIDLELVLEGEHLFVTDHA